MIRIGNQYQSLRNENNIHMPDEICTLSRQSHK